MLNLSPEQLMRWGQNEKRVLIVQKKEKEGSVVDLSLHKKGPMEDKTYLTHPDIYASLRRGVSILVPSDGGPMRYLKKGLPKFFDIQKGYFGQQQLPFLKAEARKLSVLPPTAGKISLHLKTKENGEHCQISYCGLAGKWVVGSKNVTVLVGDQHDLDPLQQIRYTWPTLISKLWLKIVAKLEPDKIVSLKESLDGTTLLGEYVGQALHQHIVKYDQQTLRFYAAVKHDSTDLSMPCSSVHQILQKFGLQGASTKSFEGLSHQQYLRLLAQQVERVGKKSLKEGGQGVVAYAQVDGRVCAISKLKTTQYLIFRRLRQLLKQLLQKEQTSACFARFRSDLNSILAENYHPSRPTQFYVQAARRAFAQAGQGAVDFISLRYRFVDFMEAIFAQIDDKGITQTSKPKRIVLLALPGLLDPALTNRLAISHGIRVVQDSYRQVAELKQNVLSVLHLVPRVPAKADSDHFIVYSLGQGDLPLALKNIESLKNSKNPAVFSLVKSSDKETALRLLSDKIASFRKAFSEKHPGRLTMVSSQAQLSSVFDSICHQKFGDSLQEVRLTCNRLVVMVPITIPGSGKSTIASILKESTAFKEGRVTILSADEIRSQVLKKQIAGMGREEREKLSQQEAFRLSSEGTKQIFEAELKQILAQPPTAIHLIYLDKNHSPSNLDSTLKFILAHAKQAPEVVGLIPHQRSEKIGCFEYPFSLGFLICCLQRSILRERHSTLCTDPIFTAQVILMFYQYFKEFNFKSPKSIGLNAFLQIGVGDGLVEEVTPELRGAVKDCLKVTKAGQHPPNSPVFLKLVEVLFKEGCPSETGISEQFRRGTWQKLSRYLE